MGATRWDLLESIVLRAELAASEPANWGPLVKDVNELFGARSAVLFTPEPESKLAPMAVTHGDLYHGTQDYFAHWAYKDEWLKAVAGTRFFQQAGEVRLSQEFLPDSALRKTAFFNEWGRRYGAEQSLALKVTDRSNLTVPVMHLTLFRRLADAPFTQEHRTMLRLLWPALQRSVQSHWALLPVHSSVEPVEATLNALPTPTWLVGADLRIDFANALARAFTRAGVWARASSGRLRQLGDLDGDMLQRYIARRGVQSGAAARVLAVSVSDTDRLVRAILHIVPISEVELYATAWPRASALLMLQIPPSAGDSDLWFDHLSKRFRLTPAQLSTLRLLALGLRVEQIALKQRIKVGTVRAHIHQLLSKTGKTNQSDLVRVALGS